MLHIPATLLYSRMYVHGFGLSRLHHLYFIRTSMRVRAAVDPVLESPSGTIAISIKIIWLSLKRAVMLLQQQSANMGLPQVTRLGY